MYRSHLVKPYTKRGLLEADRREVFAACYLTHAGNDSNAGKPYLLDDWMRENIWRPIFASGREEPDGTFRRKYRRVCLGLWRGFGKSEVAAAIILSEAVMNPVPNGQYGCVADTRENARIVKKYIATMIGSNDELKASWKPYKDFIVNRETGQEIHVYPYGEASLQGKHFNVVVCDEVHVWRDEDTWKAAVSGQRNIENALAIIITTAGASRNSAGYRIIEKLKSDKSAYVCWLGLSDGENMHDRRTWRKLIVNDRISMEDLEDQLEATGWLAFERYQLNRFPMEEEENPFMRGADVAACCKAKDAELDTSSYFTVGLDGATSGDTLAVVAYQRQDDRDVYREWIWDDPKATAAGVYDLTDVAEVVCMLAGQPGAPTMVCDPARMQFLVNWLDRNRGVQLYALEQSNKVMCPASELLARAVKTRSACLGGTPKLAEHCRNAVASESKAFGRRISSKRHGQGTKRVDAAVAAAMAMWAWDNIERETAGQVYTIDL